MNSLEPNMAATSPKPENESSMADGASEAETARKVKFEKNPSGGPDKSRGPSTDDPSGAGDESGPDGKRGGDKGSTGPDAIAPEDLSSENDDGAG